MNHYSWFFNTNIRFWQHQRINIPSFLNQTEGKLLFLADTSIKTMLMKAECLCLESGKAWRSHSRAGSTVPVAAQSWMRMAERAANGEAGPGLHRPMFTVRLCLTARFRTGFPFRFREELLPLPLHPGTLGWGGHGGKEGAGLGVPCTAVVLYQDAELWHLSATGSASPNGSTRAQVLSHRIACILTAYRGDIRATL